MRFQNYLNEEITNPDIKDFESRWKAKLAPFGITNFEFSKHSGKLKLNHDRNKPLVDIEELDYVMNGFIRKMGSQLKKDVVNVKNNTAKKRGIKKQEIPPNNLEFTVKSASNKVNFVFVLKQDRKTKGTAMILPITMMRKKNFKIKKGEEVMVERREIWT